MSIVGKSVERKDALDKVTGTAQYIDDMHFDNMLIARGVYSRVAYGKIISIDINEAKKVKGVVKIITAHDIPAKTCPIVQQKICLLQKIGKYIRELLLSAAETQEAAEEGARRVKVEYEELPPVLSIEESIREDAPKLHPHGNIHKYYKIRKGDVETGFKEADIIMENEYRTPHQEHSYLETNGMIWR
jgi:CO/xanthine dehydrogenase Mo-binding subunit